MPEDAIGGWRNDVVEAVRAMKPGVIRFGGSALEEDGPGDFEWRDTIGDPDRRKPFRAWGGLQPTGPGLEEIVQFCRLVGAEPLDLRPDHRAERRRMPPIRCSTSTAAPTRRWARCGQRTGIPNPTASSTGRSATNRAAPTTSSGCPTSARR